MIRRHTKQSKGYTPACLHHHTEVGNLPPLAFVDVSRRHRQVCQRKIGKKFLLKNIRLDRTDRSVKERWEKYFLFREHST